MIKILDVEIENFRSITGDSSKSSPVTLELSEFNVIVGQNNSGKSNILRALNLFFNGRTDIGEFDPDIDFSINSNLAGNSQTKITLSIEFTPSTDIKLANAVNSISKETGYKPLGPNRIRIRQMFSRKGTEQWRYIGSGGIKPLKEELLIPLIDAVRSAVRFKYLPVGRDIDSVIQRELKDELVSTIFSGWSSSKQKKKINDAIQKLIESLQPELERTRDEISNTASKVFRELKHLSLELPFEDIDSLLPSLIPTANDGQITALRHKGAGIQTSSLLFYLKFLADHQPQRKYSRPTYIWAIEEPESFLHPTRQREMFDVLRIFSEEVQTLITTHSAHFVPRGEGNKLFLANRELKYPFNTSVSEATYEDARTSLGVTMLDSMVLAPLNVVVEGPSDEILLGNAWRSLSKEGSINFSPDDVKFFPAGNATRHATCMKDSNLTWEKGMLALS